MKTEIENLKSVCENATYLCQNTLNNPNWISQYQTGEELNLLMVTAVQMRLFIMPYAFDKKYPQFHKSILSILCGLDEVLSLVESEHLFIAYIAKLTKHINRKITIQNI